MSIAFLDKITSHNNFVLFAWNKPRDVKLPAAPFYDVDFERKKFGKQLKQKRELKGVRP
ncbi:hypothetical protein DPMN_014084 [Dreissena polymorpha]|uniref:Uncharacterized protein n=1 Tax=Dreissena polymorpha TaxID=45954 RepID=A0A9D4N5D1_DREPO|nr:hypothetical protein DPMN_014084 [Dreissena polymorpha]